MILFYEDEEYFIRPYIEELKNNGLSAKNFKTAKEFIRFVKKNYNKIDLFVIDIMVFGPDNDFKGKDTGGGYKSGIVMLDEIESISNIFSGLSDKKIIILTNRKGEILNNIKNDHRVYKTLRKSDVLPSEFLDIVKTIIANKE